MMWARRLLDRLTGRVTITRDARVVKRITVTQRDANVQTGGGLPPRARRHESMGEMMARLSVGGR